MSSSPRRPEDWGKGGYCEFSGRQGCGHVLREVKIISWETAGGLHRTVELCQGDQIKMCCSVIHKVISNYANKLEIIHCREAGYEIPLTRPVC